jgi:hypothetical protein
MDQLVDRIALYLVYFPRIKAALNSAACAWNDHGIRTEGNQSPVLLWELSKTKAERLGFWNSDPRDSSLDASDPFYGCDGEASLPPVDELEEEGLNRSDEEERELGWQVNGDAELKDAQGYFDSIGFNTTEEDYAWGVTVYLNAKGQLESWLDQVGH